MISRYFNSGVGSVFGLWSANQCFGNIFGTLLVAYLIDIKLNIELIFIIPSLALITIAIIIVTTVDNQPKIAYTQLNEQNVTNGNHSHRANNNSDSSVELSTPTTPNSNHESINKYDQIKLTEPTRIDVEPLTKYDSNNNNNIDNTNTQKLTFTQALLVPGVLSYAFAHAFTKYVNYTCFFWLPYYLYIELNYTASYSDTISTIYDLGSVIGSILCGYLSDVLRMRIIIISVFALLSCASIILYNTFHPAFILYNIEQTSPIYSSVIMLLSGVFVGGPAALLPSACTADLCNSNNLKHSTGTITGIVDGMGSFGGGVGPVLVAYLSVHYSWSSVFYTLTVSMSCTLLALSPLLYNEIRTILGLNKQVSNLQHNNAPVIKVVK